MKVTIAFPSILKLWSFKQILHKRPIHTNIFKKRITCTCTEEEITLATSLYCARIETAK
ncbi:hypothetical protein HRH25_13390 [Flavisolibacter sp. BT320]|nr:hypothetical protein [Flavisolibacter longurius]